MTRKTKSDQEPNEPVIDIQEITRELMQMYVVRINGQDVVLLGPILGWPESTGTEVESFGFGELVHVGSVIKMLQGMQGVGEGASGMSKLQ
jgi:hypothetical protein